MLGGHLRALADRRPRRRLLHRAQAHRDWAVRGERGGAAATAQPAVGGSPADHAQPSACGAAQIGCAAVHITRLPDVTPPNEGAPPARSVAVGTFDGVHLGHRAVIDGSDSVLTFEPHPVSVIAPQHTPKLLTTLDVKAELIAGLGVRELIVIPVDAEFASHTADEFISEVLVGALGAQRV